MLTSPFILFRDDFSGEEVLFYRPKKIIVAEEVRDFFPALEEGQRAHDDGKWLAGYFSYEAGYLLEPKLAPIIPQDRATPLMVLGVFDRPSETPFPADRRPAPPCGSSSTGTPPPSTGTCGYSR